MALSRPNCLTALSPVLFVYDKVSQRISNIQKLSNLKVEDTPAF